MTPTSFLLATLAVFSVQAQKSWSIDIGSGAKGTGVSVRTLTIAQGDTVQWNNVGLAPKQVQQESGPGVCQPWKQGSFGQSSLFPGSTYSFTFSNPSTYYFYIDSVLSDCTQGAEGVINVQVPAPTNAAPSPTVAAASTTVTGNSNGNNNGNNTSNGGNSNGNSTNAKPSGNAPIVSTVAAPVTTGNSNNNNNNNNNPYPNGSPVPKVPLSGSQVLAGSSTLLKGLAIAAYFL